ncbi:hypothetical protein PVAP13_1NG067901 [Panicum virgatum]|uniref:Uncharacterized protein n=1 Tax=Panicum virgatum TaxID=38727 RepID=A0A8T0WTD3_PANVG|nr:hypothetical protein PVAP13_1NG067901 [Panicum virgatum]
MPRRGKANKPRVRMGSAFERFPLPSGVPVPMCYCGDHCKVAKSDEEDTYRQRYWMCDNFAFEPTPRQIRIGLLWIDIEISQEDKEWMETLKRLDAEL